MPGGQDLGSCDLLVLLPLELVWDLGACGLRWSILSLPVPGLRLWTLGAKFRPPCPPVLRWGFWTSGDIVCPPCPPVPDLAPWGPEVAVYPPCPLVSGLTYWAPEVAVYSPGLSL